MKSRNLLRRFAGGACGVATAVIAGAALAAGNWIINPNFDTSLAGWADPYARLATWSANDSRGVPDSGSALVSHQSPGNNGTLLVRSQCIPVTPLTSYAYGGRIKVPSGQPAGTAGYVWMYTYASTDCGGNTLDSFGKGSASATWDLRSGSFVAGATARSAAVWLGVFKKTGETADASVLFDTVYVRESGLPFAVGPSLSASWYNPAQSGHGIMLEYLSAVEAWMCWFTFDLSGNRSWICGLGNVSGNTIDFPGAFVVTGGKFPPLFDPAAIVEVPWGRILVSFTECDAGSMSWTTSATGYQSGSMPLARLTTLWANGCS